MRGNIRRIRFRRDKPLKKMRPTSGPPVRHQRGGKRRLDDLGPGYGRRERVMPAAGYRRVHTRLSAVPARGYFTRSTGTRKIRRSRLI